MRLSPIHTNVTPALHGSRYTIPRQDPLLSQETAGVLERGAGVKPAQSFDPGRLCALERSFASEQQAVQQRRT